MNVLGEVGQILHSFRDERETARRLLLRELVGQVEHAGRQDGGAQEAQEDTGTDQVVRYIRPLPLLAALLETSKHLLQLTATQQCIHK